MHIFIFLRAILNIPSYYYLSDATTDILYEKLIKSATSMAIVNARKIKLAAHLVSGETPPEKRRKFGRGERKKLDLIS